jgi:long-chain acyl-CoA synthetase
MIEDEPNVAQFLLAGKNPERTALLSAGGRRYSYGDLQRRVDQVAQTTLAMGWTAGDRIILIAENSFFWVSTYLGILRAGLVCVPVPRSISAGELEHIASTTEAKAIFVERALGRGFETSLARLVTEPEIAGTASGSKPDRAFPALDRNDLAALMFTSGSTGRPRGVMVSHGNIIANSESIIEYLRLREADRILAILPFHYCFGASLLHTHLRVGASVVIENRFMYPETVLQRMIETECTGLAGVPSHFHLLLRNSSVQKKNFSHLRYVQQAGGHLAPTAIRELCAAFPNAEVFIMYGQTEATARLSYLPPERLIDKIGSIGKGIPGVVLRVVNEAGEEVHPGEIGEIVARGANITRGYWRAPQETSESFRDGELRTGDQATVDRDGFIYIVGRARDFLKCGGERVSCLHLEEELLASSELLEAAVIAIADDLLGEAPKAFVVSKAENREGVEERLAIFLKERLPAHLVPREIVVVRSLPKNSAGKVEKHRLRPPNRV